MSTLNQRAFSGGELAPVLHSRVDTSKYQTGARTLRNHMIMRHGGATTRPGTEFIAEVKTSTLSTRTIPFIFNSEQTYILEFGNQYIRFYRNGAQLSDLSLTITGITNANPAVVTYTGTDPTSGQEVYISGVVGAIGTYVNGRNFKIANVNGGANTFELQYMNSTNVNSTSFGTYTSGGTAERIYEISSPYATADLFDLKFVQSADVITIVHPSYAPRELSRSGHTSWTLSTITFAPGISAPTGLTSGSAGSTFSYVVTAVDSETFEESLASSAHGTTTSTVTLTWNAVSGAGEYNVYRASQGIYGLIGVAGSNTFADTGITPDTSDTPPQARNPFGSTDNYPSTVSYIQQRLTFANTNNDTEKIWMSRTGNFKNFTVSSPVQDDDAVTFTLAGRQVNAVKNLIDLKKLIVLTTGGEWVVDGDDAGIIKPTAINPQQSSYFGSGELQPIIIGNNAFYQQARGSIIRDLAFSFEADGYQGSDLTIFAAHLFDGFTLIDWAYQQIPHSILWAVRDDGVLLGLTYVREQQIFAWHKHDFTGGTVESVTVIPEGNEDRLYLVINRTIDGRTTRYVERMVTRFVDDVKDCKFMDSHLSYDGRNTNTSHTMTLSGGTDWDYLETLTLTSSASYFSSTEVGNQIHLTGSDGTIIRATITAYTSATVVSVQPNITVPVAMRSTAISNWARAVDEVSGLWHLEGELVSIFGDGFVVASPNNDSYDEVEITNGSATLDKQYSVIHVGLPYLSDLETLNIDTVNGETISDKKMIVSRVSIFTEKSRGIWVGAEPPEDDDTDPLENLVEIKIRNAEGMDDPVELKSEVVDVNIQPHWNSNGRIFIRQVDPVPLTILSIMPAGLFPFRGQG